MSLPADLPPTAPHPLAMARQARRLYGQAVPWLHDEVARRLDSKLDWVKMQPASWVEWVPGWGGGQDQVKARYPQARHGRLATPMPGLAAGTALVSPGRGLAGWRQALQQWWTGADERVWLPDELDQAPWMADGAQMLWANMSLHTLSDLPGTLRLWARQLAPQGFLMCSGLGPDTARELRALYAIEGWGLPTIDFIDMHDLGDELAKAGFADPVMDMERIQLTWVNPEALLAELRTWGGNVAQGRFEGCRGRAWRQRWLEAVGHHLRDADGRIRLTVEVVYGHAIKPEARAPLQAESRVSLEDMRRMVRRPREP